jgi:hypothetical protein
MTNMETLGVKCLWIEGDSKVLHVQFPKEIKDTDVRLIAILAKIIEEGKASVSLDEIDGRPAILLTISGEGFPLHLPVGKSKHGALEMADDLKPKLDDVPDERTNDDEELLRQICRNFVAQEAEQEAGEEGSEEMTGGATVKSLWIGQQYYGEPRECVFIDDDASEQSTFFATDEQARESATEMNATVHEPGGSDAELNLTDPWSEKWRYGDDE